jgi:hypothetical protein
MNKFGSTGTSGFWATLTLAGALAVACGPSAQPESVGTTTADLAACSPPKPAPIEFDLVFPVGYGLARVGVGASERLRIGSQAHVLGTDGTPGVASSVGASPTTLEERASVGVLFNGGDVRVEEKAVANKIVSGGRVRLEKAASVGAVTEHATLSPFARRTIRVPVPASDGGNVEVERGTSRMLAPAKFGRVHVERGGVLTVQGGTYLADSFEIEDGAELRLDTSDGSVSVYVRNDAELDGTVTGDGSRFLLGYLGDRDLRLTSRFQGTALAPHGAVRLARGEGSPASSSPIRGTFYGKELSVEPGVTVREVPPPLLIDNMSVASTTLCVGQSTEVKVDASSIPGATVRINDVVGSRQFVEFHGAPGLRVVYATVFTADGKADIATVPVTVQSCPPTTGAAPPVALHYMHAYSTANVIDFIAYGFDGNGLETRAPAGATYSWSFGDGQTAVTGSPIARHDYSSAVDPLAPYSYFNASVTVTTSSGPSTAQKVVPLWSLYAKNRAKGIVQPPSKLSGDSGHLAMTLTNYEATPLTITSSRIDLLPCDPALAARRQLPQPLSVIIPASASGTVVLPPLATFPADVCALGVHVMGSTAAGAVYSDSYFSGRENPLHLTAVSSPSTIALLNQAAQFSVDPDRFDVNELRQLFAQARISSMPPAIPPGTTYENVGDECEPGQTAPGLVCAPTTDWVAAGATLLNAFPGDIFMDHGCGKVGKLLAAIGQNYSHDSLMMNRGTRVRHSTASEDRESSAIQVDKVRLDPDFLQFGFPGTQGPGSLDQKAPSYHSISEMTSAYTITDPDGSTTWRLGNEHDVNPAHWRCDGDLTPVPPVIARPSPDAPANVLAGVTSVPVTSIGLNAHYRFFAYTRGDQIGPDFPTGAAAGWAAGTDRTVCSSFAWLAANSAGLPLTPSSGAANIPSGMQKYSPEQRLAAAQSLYASTSNSVGQACSLAPDGGAVLGGAAEFLYGGPAGAVIAAAALGAGAGAGACGAVQDRIANQVVNCFANDGCSVTDGTWHTPGDGVAVSPDNILEWDVASKGGSYGYNEPAAFLPEYYRHRYRWIKKVGDGTIDVKVIGADGNPFPLATISLNGIEVGTTDNSGHVLLDHEPAASYEVEAEADACGRVSPPPPAAPPAITPADLLALPQCTSGSNGPPCKHDPAYSCPAGYLQGLCVLPVAFDKFVCECYRDPGPACLGPFFRGEQLVSLPADGHVSTTIKLCAIIGADGKPTSANTSCQQSCANASECDAGFSCEDRGDGQGQVCWAPRRRVHVRSLLSDVQTYDGSNPVQATEVWHPQVDFYCDPNDTPTGGRHIYTYCARSHNNSPGSWLRMDVSCQVDQLTGEIRVISNDLRLESGCCSDPTSTDANCAGVSDEKDAIQWSLALPPPTSGNPTPFQRYDGAASCYQPPVCIGCDACTHSAAQLNFGYTSEAVP